MPPEKNSDCELDPRGYASLLPPLPEGTIVDYMVVHPNDSPMGMKLELFQTMDEAKYHVLLLQEQGIEELGLLRNHEVVWSTDFISQ